MIMQTSKQALYTTKPLQLDVQIEVSTIYAMGDCHVTYPTIVSLLIKNLVSCIFSILHFLA